MIKQVEQVRRFLYGWMAEGGPNGAYAPGLVASLYGLTFDYAMAVTPTSPWQRMQDLDSAIEDWAIDLGVGTTCVDDTHPDAPWGDNLVRKLMVIRGVTAKV